VLLCGVYRVLTSLNRLLNYNAGSPVDVYKASGVNRVKQPGGISITGENGEFRQVSTFQASTIVVSTFAPLYHSLSKSGKLSTRAWLLFVTVSANT